MDSPQMFQDKVTKPIKKDEASTLAKPSQYKKPQVKSRKVLNGRPQEAHGLPVGLFHPVFDSFQQRIDSDSFVPTARQLSNTLPLLAASQEMYDEDSEGDEVAGPDTRTEALKPLLQWLLGFHISNVSIRETKSDGVVQESNGATLMFMQVGNGIATSECDPSVQGAIAFANYWGQLSLQWLRDQCCCPSMILAIAGPWMCVLGGIMLEHPVVQPLTPFFLVGNNPSSPGHTNTVAKIFASLAKALRELHDFYRGFRMSTATLNPTRHFPYIREFSLDGKRVDIEYRKPLVPGRAVFLGVARPQGGSGYKVIVKFVESYNAAAHRVLEEINLAPKLIYISSEGPDAFKVARAHHGGDGECILRQSHRNTIAS
ncbi:kinase domain protein, putative [Rhizoctonia solani AG-3 Rhs1AP]|uniref:Kinase domain protein, putative n=1 Tax=Rhizoctonia solani AG-3 Rhs1AP TaxID=1086054 RepID=X8J2T1_9AGAM|nr:kinase domain protein, putative [Rhizoctonia solani AG-3 Rhs1AP]